MDLSKLDKNEQLAARVYIRRRRKAMDHFFFLQDLKHDDFLSSFKEDHTFKIMDIKEGYEAYPFDFVLDCMDIKTAEKVVFVFNWQAHESGLMNTLIGLTKKPNKVVYNSYGLKKNDSAKVLYGSKV